jgi:hypothetical protein
MSIRRRSRLVYGYPGGAIMPVYDELYKFKDQLHHVLVRTRARCNTCCKDLQSNRKVGVASSDLSNQLSYGIADAQIDSHPWYVLRDKLGKHLLGSDARNRYYWDFNSSNKVELPLQKLGRFLKLWPRLLHCRSGTSRSSIS